MLSPQEALLVANRRRVMGGTQCISTDPCDHDRREQWRTVEALRLSLDKVKLAEQHFLEHRLAQRAVGFLQ